MNRSSVLRRHPLRIIALILFLSGTVVAVLLFSRMPANPLLFLGGMIWVSWLARACLPSMPRAACVKLWLVTLLWSSLMLFLTKALFGTAPGMLSGFLLLHILVSIAAASAGLLKDHGSRH